MRHAGNEMHNPTMHCITDRHSYDHLMISHKISATVLGLRLRASSAFLVFTVVRRACGCVLPTVCLNQGVVLYYILLYVFYDSLV